MIRRRIGERDSCDGLEGIRTPGPLRAREVLYQAELRAHTWVSDLDPFLRLS
jgi:hypothetical protein